MNLDLEEFSRTESRRCFATLVRLLNDFDLAEEALQEAFAAALVQWPRDGLPQNPRSWLISTGRFKAIDVLRRRTLLDATDATISGFKEAWAAAGDSIVIVGGDGLWNCHIHTNDIGAAIEAGIDAGRPHHIRVTDLIEEVEEE